ncbi:hypothetical protein Peur_025287 [Populus x canadensis]
MAPEKLAELWALDPNEPKGTFLLLYFLSSRIIPSFYLANEACQICSVIFQLASLRLSMFLSYLFLLHQCYAMKNQCHTFK